MRKTRLNVAHEFQSLFNAIDELWSSGAYLRDAETVSRVEKLLAEIRESARALVSIVDAWEPYEKA